VPAKAKKTRFIKISTKGKELAADAKKWDAVLDTTTGLMWTVKEQKAKNHAAAVTAAEKTKAASYVTGWRLPTVEELFCLADRSKYRPAIDTDYFPDCKSDFYWTGTPWAESPSGYAWFVSFDNGNSYCYHHGNDGFVRAVRASQ
jgi:hypothetical protein